MNKLILFVLASVCFSTAYAQKLFTGVPTTDGQVLGVQPVGDTIYVWGQFSHLGDSVRRGLGSFNIHTGAVTAFNPNANAYIISATIAANRMLIGGNFDTLNGQFHIGAAIIDLNTGLPENWIDEEDFSFGPNVAGYDSTYFYYFNGTNIKRVNYHTNITDAWHTTTITNFGSDAICATDSFLYSGAGGGYDTGIYALFNFLCRFRKADGSLDTSWHPQPNCINNSEGINSIGVNRYNQLFVAGQFTTIAGQSRQGIAGFDANTGAISAFNPDISSHESFYVDVTDNDVWLGCNSYLIGGQYRWRLAEIDINSGTATCWDASAVTQSWNSCGFVSVAGDTVYASGSYGSTIYVFTGSPRPHPASDVIQGPITANPGQTFAYGVPDSLGYTYSWLIDGGTGYSIGDSISITWGNGPVGIIKMVENNNNYSTCSSDTVELIVTIASCPAGPDSITGPANAVVNQPANYTVPVTPGAAYNWIVTGGTGISSTNGISVTWGTGATGTLQLIETNDSLPFCRTDTLTRTITLLPSGVQDIDEISARISPNPTAGKVRLQTTGACTGYSIYDITGKLLEQSPINSVVLDVDLGQFTQGVYIITVQGINKEVNVKVTKL